MSKEELIKNLKESRKELMEAISGLTEADMERKDILDWTIKEALTRILAWDYLTTEDVQNLLKNKQPRHLDQYKDHAEEKFVSDRKGKTPSEILDEINKSTESVIQLIESIDELELNKDRGVSWKGDNITLDWLLDYSDHDRDIIKEIWEWRMKKGFDEGKEETDYGKPG